MPDPNQIENKDDKGQQQTNQQTSQQKPPQGESFEIEVDGEKKVLTRDEMVKQAQLGFASTKRFQDASAKEKANAEKIRMADMVANFSNPEYEPTEAEITEFAAKIGVDPKEFMEFLNDNNDDGKGDKGGKGLDLSNIDEKAAQAIVQKALGISPAEAKQVIEYSQQRHIRDAKKEIREMSDKAVDKDEIFGKIIVGEGREDKLAVAKELVAEDVLRKIQDGMPFGAELVAASVQKIRAHLQKFGIPGKPDQYPVTLGLGPSEGLPAEVLQEKPIDRKKAVDDGDESNFIARWMQKMIKAQRSR